MKNKTSVKAVLLAVLAAVTYSFDTPFSKVLLSFVPPVFMASFLYIGAGTGIGILYFFARKKDTGKKLSKEDMPSVIGMIALDIIAPVLLMTGLSMGSASGASLLGNFEVAATAMIACCLFGEPVSKRLWAAIGIITLACVILSLEESGSFRFSKGAVLVLLASACWGLENNCTRKISGKSTYEIVILKGFFTGAGAFLLALLSGENLPQWRYVLPALLLGFVSYGLSIFLYVRAQYSLGAARTGAYYAIVPFVGSFLSFVILGESLTPSYFLGLVIMIAGTWIVVKDTLQGA